MHRIEPRERTRKIRALGQFVRNHDARHARFGRRCESALRIFDHETARRIDTHPLRRQLVRLRVGLVVGVVPIRQYKLEIGQEPRLFVNQFEMHAA